MNKQDKISDLLQKKNLSDEELALLNSLIENDPESKEFYDAYSKIDSALKSPHISYNDLRDYILYKNNMCPEDQDVVKRIPDIESHMKKCERCANEFKNLGEEYSELEFFLSEKLAEGKTDEAGKANSIYTSGETRRTPLYLFTSLIAMTFIILSLLVVSDIVTPDNYELARLEDKSEFYVTRGRATDEFQESLKALEEEDYGKAISCLQEDIDKNPGDQTIFYSHYILGLSYLENAEKSFAGLFESFNENDVRAGLENLKLCTEKNSSGRFPDITYNAYFYYAKGSLMLNDVESAKKYLRMVVSEKGSKMSEAQELLNELE